MRDRLLKIIMETETGRVETSEIIKTYSIKYGHSKNHKGNIQICLERFKGRSFRKYSVFIVFFIFIS